MNKFIRNILSTVRSLDWLKRMTGQNRDYEAEFGHPPFITTEDYWKKFDRGDVANRIVSIYPEECFSEAPLIYETEDDDETEFETAWNALNDELHMSSIFLRADILSGIGRFGVILLGLDDGLDLKLPVAGMEINMESTSLPSAPVVSVRKLIYIRAFDETLVNIKSMETDPTNPRFGQPTLYEITFWTEGLNDTSLGGQTGVATSPPPSGINKTDPNGMTSVKTTLLVHWHRIVHVADNRLRDDVFGVPRLKKVWDRVLDLHKITGGSAEMFWKGAFPGLALETHPSDEPVTIDKDATKAEMEKFQDGLQRYIALEGMTANSLSPQAVDPTPHAELQIRLISMALSCPWRVFMGAEVGALASGQDIVAWNGRLAKRREEYVSPYLIRPVVDRLIQLGVLPFPSGGGGAVTAGADAKPRPTYIIFWNDLNTPSTAEQADVAQKRTAAMASYVSGGVDQLVDPHHFLELVVGFSKDETEAIIQEVGDRMIETDPEAEHQQALDKIAATAAARPPMPPGRGAPNPALNAENGNRVDRFGWDEDEVEITPAPASKEDE